MRQIFNEYGCPLDMSKIEFLSNQGSEFIVYKYLDLVLKIYKEDYQLSHLSLEDLNTLKNIFTQRILLPTGTLWNDSPELIGYEMLLVSGEKSIDSDDLDNFFKELKVIKQDLDLLCSNSIILRDINLSNTIYNGQIYLVDPGNYLVDGLHKIIFHMDISGLSISEDLFKILKTGDYNDVRELMNSLSTEEKLDLLRRWNYDKINKLIDMLLFSKREGVDSFKFRQIVQFLMREREANGFIYNLDVLKMFFNRNLCIGEAIDDFIKRYIQDNPNERRLYYSLLGVKY